MINLSIITFCYVKIYLLTSSVILDKNKVNLIACTILVYIHFQKRFHTRKSLRIYITVKRKCNICFYCVFIFQVLTRVDLALWLGMLISKFQFQIQVQCCFIFKFQQLFKYVRQSHNLIFYRYKSKNTFPSSSSSCASFQTLMQENPFWLSKVCVPLGT